MSVVVVNGRGGRSGITYRLRLDSLPAELQTKWLAEHSLPAEPARRVEPARRQRADKGKRRVLVSHRWDRSGAFDQATKERVAGQLLKRVRSLWAAGAPSERQVARLATAYLAKLSRKAGLDLPDAALLKVCAVPRELARRERKYRIIAIKDQDAKAFADRQPRIRRDYGGLAPLELVIADVHPIDIHYTREDGSTQPLRLIAWLDGATNRLAGHVYLPPKGAGVRMAHVAASFAHMILAWGVPGCLYLDNGGEYNWAEFARDAMALTKVHSGTEGERTLIKAQPYNAAAKKIEGIFAVLERGPFAMLPGWIGGNRMAAKTHNVGKAPKPFPGGPEELSREIQKAIAYYNATPQDGLGGRSPDQAWAEAAETGWAPVKADMAKLQAAFARDKLCTVRQGAFRLDNEFYTHDELCRLVHLEKVIVRVPIFGGRARLAVLDEHGAFLCHAEPDTAYHPMDTAGAREASRRKSLAAQGVAALRRDIEPVDLSAEMTAFLALNPPPAEPDAAGTIGLSPEMERIAEDRRTLGPEHRRIEDEKIRALEQRRAETMATLARLAG